MLVAGDLVIVADHGGGPSICEMAVATRAAALVGWLAEGELGLGGCVRLGAPGRCWKVTGTVEDLVAAAHADLSTSRSLFDRAGADVIACADGHRVDDRGFSCVVCRSGRWPCDLAGNARTVAAGWVLTRLGVTAG